MEEKREERFDQRLFPNSDNPRPWKFKRKKVYLVTSRVHPGETPASYVFNGFLKFVLRKDDPRAQQLRRQFVIKMIPMLNPDGVSRGHYRTDTRGVNLNRVYLDPDFTVHPAIYATKALLVHHHVNDRLRRDQMNLRMQSSQKQVPSQLTRQQVRMAAEEAERVRQLKEILAKPIEAPSVEALHAKNRTYHIVHDDNEDDTLIPVEQAPTSLITSPDLHPSCDGTSNQSMFQSCDREGAVAVESEVSTREKHMMLDQSLMSQELLWTPVNDTHTPHPPAKPAIVSMKFSNPERSAKNNNSGSNDKEAIKSSSTPILGNEGSDGESDEDVAAFNPAAPVSPHLCDPSLLEIPPEESGISFYIDLHGHCSKRGCFMYGNNLETEEQMVENLVFPKLIALNTAHFDFSGCNFSVKNMYQRDKRDGLSKEGAGRVAIWKHLGLIHSYTLECNYNTGRMVNHVPAVVAGEDGGRATPPPVAGFPPKYTISHYEEVGRAMAVAGLDMYCTNPWSRVNSSEQGGLNGVREWVRKYLRGLRGGPRYLGPTNHRSSRYPITSGSSSGSSQSQAFGSGVNRQPFHPGTSSVRAPGQQGAVNTAMRLSRPPGGAGIPASNCRRSSFGNGKPVITHNSSAVTAAANHSVPPHGNRPTGNQGTKAAISKQEKTSAISRQNVSHNRSGQVSRTEPPHESGVPLCSVAVPPSVCNNPTSAHTTTYLGQPSSSQLPGSIEILSTSVSAGGSVSDSAATDEAAYRQKAARVLLQMEMISCGASVSGLRQRPFSKTRPSAGATRSIPLLSSTAAANTTRNSVTTTIGESRIILLPYDSSMTSTNYSNSSPLLPQMSAVVNVDSEPVLLHSRQTAATSDPAIQHSVLDQKMLEDRKLEKLRCLKDPKRRRHDGTSPPHRLGTLKLGSGGNGGAGSMDIIGRRKSRRSMSFAGKTGTIESTMSNKPGGTPPGGLIGVTGLSDHGGSVKVSGIKNRAIRHHRRRKTGLHGKQAVFSEGDVGKDGNDGEDSSSPSDLCQANEEPEMKSRVVQPNDLGITSIKEVEPVGASPHTDEGNELPFSELFELKNLVG